jgi:hypothetical protein
MLGQLRIAVRMLVEAPAFTAMAALALAFGIGAPAATLSALDHLPEDSCPHNIAQDAVLCFAYSTSHSDRDYAAAYE